MSDKMSAEELETAFDDVRDGLGRGDQFSDSQAYKSARPAITKIETHAAALEADIQVAIQALNDAAGVIEDAFIQLEKTR